MTPVHTKKKLHFSTTIHAPREVVWKTMLGPDTFREWTAEFAEGSYYEGGWGKGERIRFLTPGGSGMSSRIAASRPNEFVSIEHLGLINNGVEDTESEAVRAWRPAFENYTLSTVGNATRVDVEMDVTSDFEADMSHQWPKALAKLKAITEVRG
jgi:hypothetical protein